MSSIDPQARLGQQVVIDWGAVVEAGAVLGDGCHVGSNCYVASGVEIGAGTHLEPGAVLLEGTRVGQRCKIGAGVVVGGSGFGYVEDQGQHVPIPQVGGVRIGDDTIIGPGTCVDRATLNDTEIGSHCRIGSLVQVAHNVTVGDRTRVDDQVGMAGSSTVGSDCHLGFQAGMAGHASLGDHSLLWPRAATTRKSPPHSDLWGFPARPRSEAKRVVAAMHQLPRILAESKPEGSWGKPEGGLPPQNT